LEQENQLDKKGASARTHDDIGDDGINDAYLVLEGNENSRSRRRFILETYLGNRKTR